MRLPILADGRYGGGERHAPAAAPARTSQELIEVRVSDLLLEEGEQVLLERPARLSGSAAQLGMDLGRDVLDLNAGHLPTIAPKWRVDM
jgi:hypothetical protein